MIWLGLPLSTVGTCTTPSCEVHLRSSMMHVKGSIAQYSRLLQQQLLACQSWRCQWPWPTSLQADQISGIDQLNKP